MKRTVPLFVMLTSLYAFGQQPPAEQTQAIVAEGKLLYYSEMASWHGSDLFFGNYKKADTTGGYFSYRTGGFIKCIFYSNEGRAKVIGTVRFDSSFNPETASLDLTESDFTPVENELYLLREATLNEMDTDTLFKSYPNTDLDVVPLINGNEKKVYVLTASQQDSIVLLGNDYLLTFDNSNKVLVKKKLHPDLIPIYYDEKSRKQMETVHTHSAESGDFITATDICTLMLYEKFTKWKTHQVTSTNYLNIWNCNTNQLTIISKATEKETNKEISIDDRIRITTGKDQVRRSKKRGQAE